MKLCFILSAFLVLSVSFSSLAFADHDPVICYVEINYKGHDYGGHEDGLNETEAAVEAKEEACERACRFSTDACERDCMKSAVLRKQDCRENPKAHKNYRQSDAYFCRTLIRYDGKELEASDSAQNVDKAGRDAFDEACDEICDDRFAEKKCKRDCRISAEILGIECTDRDNRIVEMHGRLSHHHVNGAAEASAARDRDAHPMDKFKAGKKAEKEALKAEKEALKAEKEALKAEKEALKAEKKAAKKGKKAKGVK